MTPAAPAYSHQIAAGTRQEVVASSWAPTHYSYAKTYKTKRAKGYQAIGIAEENYKSPNSLIRTQAADVELDQLSAGMELTEENVEQVARQSRNTEGADQAGPLVEIKKGEFAGNSWFNKRKASEKVIL